MVNIGVQTPLARTRVANERNQKAQKPDDGASFTEALGSETHTERKVTPGREDRTNANREGKRPDERESSSTQSQNRAGTKKQYSKPAPKKDEARAEVREDLRSKETDDDRELNADDGRFSSVQAKQKQIEKPVSKDEGTSDLEGVQQAADARDTKPIVVEASDSGPAVEGQFEVEGFDLEANSENDAKSMQEFADQMQKQFGIGPEKIVEAFSKLTPQQLAGSPEKSAQALIDNLGLKGADNAKASEMYQNLIASTGLQGTVFSASGNVSGNVKLGDSDQPDEALTALAEALDGLSTAFESKASEELPSTNGKAPAGIQSTEDLQAQLAARMMARNAPTDEKVSVEEVETEVSDVDADSLSATTTSLDLPVAPNELKSGAEQQQFGQENGQDGSQSNSQSFSQNLKDKAETSSAKEIKKGEAKAFSVDTKASTDVDASAATPGTVAADLAAGKDSVATKAAGPLAPLTPTEQADVKEMARQAQLVVRDGGGEMSIAMKTEGMGEVKLKVKVEDGQVSVQMLTESAEAKRLLEKGLHELKSHLTAENLKVDTLKVDVGSDIQKHMDQQANQDQSRQSARQMAGEFMDQFRQERQGFRQGFMESSGRKSYNQNQNRASVEPQAVTSSNLRAGSSSRLNLVA